MEEELTHLDEGGKEKKELRMTQILASAARWVVVSFIEVEEFEIRDFYGKIPNSVLESVAFDVLGRLLGGTQVWVG